MIKPVPYEIHVTVKTKDVEGFKKACEELKVKPIVLDLQEITGHKGIMDVMTSSKLTGDDGQAFQELERIKEGLTEKSFEVVREKIETVPWHPQAILHDMRKTPNGKYYEAHIAVPIAEDQLSDMSLIAWKYGLHLSRNPFKVLEDGKTIQMMTIRYYNAPAFVVKHYLGKVIKALRKKKLEPTRWPPTLEYALHDSEVGHDANWFKSVDSN